MKFYTRITGLALVGAFTLSATSLAAPDVAGTKTIVISLATGDNGQFIPVVIDKNSALNELSQTESTPAAADASVGSEEETDDPAISNNQSASKDVINSDEASIEQTVDNLTTVSSEQTTPVADDSDSDTDEEDNKDTAANATTTAANSANDSTASSNASPESESAAASNSRPSVIQMVVVSAFIYAASAKQRLF
ncbi:hypothetical protein IW140_002092 [Coemansia sp. RSA 1813]|nr:hypothetical protein EV178_001241 [Coemansia sp. RSA 1646]KAJ1772594.1 hypothetical protein LPJ74_001310 [Coemansia sp. RSA 1843]KAJ2091450.1 hypothetical protein IW138_001909 [Coemansia sp. RSA 986]KAJ2570666.1 hypothetical protein IW140_002092 [Coemansia sp. RSA 1813]